LCVYRVVSCWAYRVSVASFLDPVLVTHLYRKGVGHARCRKWVQGEVSGTVTGKVKGKVRGKVRGKAEV
jgi:hypothetical protein